MYVICGNQSSIVISHVKFLVFEWWCLNDVCVLFVCSLTLRELHRKYYRYDE
jgi:uncharacterized membrane protein YwzB